MLGTIIGDIAGSRFEHASIPPSEGFELFHADCTYTDDTVLTIAVADAILNNRPYDERLKAWATRYPHPGNGYGPGFAQWVNTPPDTQHNSCGNGSAMRVAPVGWLFNDFHTVLAQAENSAQGSHNHPEGIRGAQCVAALVYWLRTSRIAKHEVETAVRQKFGYTLPTLREVMAMGASGHFDALCGETVPAAITCFMASNSFEEAIRLAVMARGDTDTKAAIAGALAEAWYEIPDSLAEAALNYLPKDMLTVADAFYARLQQEEIE